MKLVLCRSPGLGSLILRAYMGSRWSHAAVWDDAAGYVTDTTLWQGGVLTHHESDFFAAHPQFRVIDVPVQEVEAARAWLQAQVGKGYDWSALFGIFFRTGLWEDDDKWFCSELGESFITRFSRRRFQEIAARITPYHQDILA